MRSTDGTSIVSSNERPFPVLLYHSVSDVARDRFTVGRAQFKEHVAAIRDSGRHPMLISEVADCLRGVDSWPERPVAITFDDGYADTAYAVDVLASNGLSATVYITAGWVGGPRFLGESDLRALAAQPEFVELGAHSVSHPYLDSVPRHEAAAEISQSKDALEDFIDSEVRSFAYPHGAHDGAVQQLVVAAGFHSAAAVKNAVSHPGDDPLAIARLTIMSNWSTERMETALAGIGVSLPPDAERVRTRAARGVRRLQWTLRHRRGASENDPPGDEGARQDALTSKRARNLDSR